MSGNQTGTISHKPSDRFYWLDWLRFTAALMVVACHARGWNWVEWGRLDSGSQTKVGYFFFAVTRAGFEWVIVFFVLSGFLVGGKVLKRVASGTFDWRSYAIDRISRIWLPLIPALLLTAGVACFGKYPVSISELFGSLFGLQGILCGSFGGNYPLWSLAYEIWFYLLAGFAAVVIGSRSKASVWAYLGVALCLAVFTRLNSAFLFCWVLGGISYSLTRKTRNWPLVITGCLLGAAGCIMSQLKSDTVSLNKQEIQQLLPSANVAVMIMTVGLALLIPAVSRLAPSSNAMVWLEKIGGRLAAFSYTLYLTHYPLLAFWSHFMPARHLALDFRSIVLFLARVTTCLLIAWLLYLPFEAQTDRVRKWLRVRCVATCGEALAGTPAFLQPQNRKHKEMGHLR